MASYLKDGDASDTSRALKLRGGAYNESGLGINTEKLQAQIMNHQDSSLRLSTDEHNNEGNSSRPLLGVASKEEEYF